MKTTLAALIAPMLLLAAGPAAPQASAPAPTPAAPSTAQPQERPAAPPRLILRLDEIEGPRMSVGRSAGETDPKKDLPALGGDARPVDLSRPRESIFPKESTNTAPTPY
jgi:hypothetical protein